MKELKELEKYLNKRKQPKNSSRTVDEWELLEFKRRLNQPPPESILRKNPEYGNQYIPLQYVEVILSILFDYWYPVMRHKPDFIDGQTVFYVDVIVGHPVLKIEQVYSGVSVVGTMPNESNYRDVHKRLPAGESFAILNAVQKIGRLFRPQQESFISALDNYFEKETKEEVSEMYKRLKKMIETSKEPYNKIRNWVVDAEKSKKISGLEAAKLYNILIQGLWEIK